MCFNRLSTGVLYRSTCAGMGKATKDTPCKVFMFAWLCFGKIGKHTMVPKHRALFAEHGDMGTK